MVIEANGPAEAAMRAFVHWSESVPEIVELSSHDEVNAVHVVVTCRTETFDLIVSPAKTA